MQVPDQLTVVLEDVRSLVTAFGLFLTSRTAPQVLTVLAGFAVVLWLTRMPVQKRSRRHSTLVTRSLATVVSVIIAVLLRAGGEAIGATVAPFLASPEMISPGVTTGIGQFGDVIAALAMAGLALAGITTRSGVPRLYNSHVLAGLSGASIIPPSLYQGDPNSLMMTGLTLGVAVLAVRVLSARD
ncbi:MAG: hypothetical protein EXR45_02510 [Chloroflexi bacterium]|nr:hypothetical protein [Chloroflexota bacterium]